MVQRPTDLPILRDSPQQLQSPKWPRWNASCSTDQFSPITFARCARCNLLFDKGEVFVNTENKTWHNECFRCAQCFELLLEKLHYSIGGRHYCESDFKTLFAPTCYICGEFIIGRVLKAIGHNWHPNCLRCSQCNMSLENEGVWHHEEQILCQTCVKLTKKNGRKLCAQCNSYIDADKGLSYRNATYHPCHFDCAECSEELDENARVYDGRLYCLRCHDRRCLICAACRHPIENERIVHAIKKHWHVEHFICAKCEKPFYGSKFIERLGRPYCSVCFTKCFADVCFKCDCGLTGASLKVFSKFWCPQCYTCCACDKLLTQKSKVVEVDMRPVCCKCFERLPKELRERMLSTNRSLPKTGIRSQSLR